MADHQILAEGFDIGSGALQPDPEILETGRSRLDAYWAESRFNDEREVFGRVWLNLAEVIEVPNPGDWIVREIPIRSVSVIIVRGKDMKIRAFHNVCAHRGMKLVWDEHGRGGKFACPYHAWIYNAEGELTHLTDQACFKDVDQQQSGLTPIACDIWEGLVFVNLDPHHTQSLQDYMAPVAERIKNIPFSAYPHTVRVTSTVAANWKLCIEAQSETYHVRALHSRTVVKMMVTPDDPFGHSLECLPLGPHGMTTAPSNPDFEVVPERLVQGFAFRNAVQMVVADTGAAAKGPGFPSHPDINKYQQKRWGNDQYIIFPHFIFHLGYGGWWLHRFWPVSADETFWEIIYHFEKPESLRNQFALQYTMALGRDTVSEDNVALMQQQQIMKSGAKDYVQFGDQEGMCKHLAAVGAAVVQDLRRNIAA